MKMDYEVAEPQEKRRVRYDFSGVRPGASTHVKTSEERVRIMAAFKYWTQNRDNKKLMAGAYCVSLKVDDTDPAGPGYRIWFRSKRADAVPVSEVDQPAADEI